MPRIRLRTFFLAFFCAAIGLTIGTRPETEENKWAASLGVYRLSLNWHHACLAAASVAIVIGLVQQAAYLRRIDLGHFRDSDAVRFSWLISITWRLICAGLLVICLLTTLLVSAQIVALPESEAMFTYELFPYIVWACCIMLALIAGLPRWRQQRGNHATSRWRALIFWISGPLIVLLVLPDLGFVHYLVHIATQGIENAQPLVYRRAGEFPEHSAEGFRDFWMSLAASACVFLASAFLFIANTAPRERRHLRQFGIIGFIAALTLVAGYCLWYYGVEYHRISPYLAVGGLASNWLERTAGTAILFGFVTAGSYYAAMRDSPSFTVTANHEREKLAPAIHESVACLLLLVIGTAMYILETVLIYASSPWTLSSRTGLARIVEIAGTHFRDPATLLMVLVGLASLQLCWQRWRRRAEHVEWTIRAIDRRRFAWNWAALGLLAAVGIPTLSSFCFVYWLGPWYLYQP